MLVRSLALLLGLFLSATSFAQTVSLTFEGESPRTAWIGGATIEGEPLEAVRSSRNGFDISTTSPPPNALVYVRDEKSGNVASRSLSAAKAGWLVKASDFSRAFQVNIKVVSGNKPVAAGLVEFSSKSDQSTALLDPGREGTVSFFGVPFGELKVTVKTVTDGKDADPVKQVFSLKKDRADGTPTFTVSVPGAVATVGDAEAGRAAPEPAGSAEGESKNSAEPKEKAPSGGGLNFGSVVSYLIGFVAVGGLIYFALSYYRQNQKQVDDKLTQLGVQIPTTDDLAKANASTPLPDPPSQPAPVQKIMLDPGASDPVPVSPANLAASAATGVHRLIASTGDEIPIGAELTVGREAGLGLSLTSETTVSRRHATVSVSAMGATVTDLGSTNGTFVNGSRITGAVSIRPGDTINFGQASFRYEA